MAIDLSLHHLLKKIFDRKAYTPTTIKQNAVQDILDYVYNPVQTGFGKVSTSSGVQLMWSNTAFRTDIEQLNTLLGDANERLQLKVTDAMFKYNTFCETSALLLKRVNQLLKNIAKEVK